MSKEHIHVCDECQHVFTQAQINAEADDSQWGHPCFDTSMRGNKRCPGKKHRCESFRTIFEQVKP